MKQSSVRFLFLFLFAFLIFHQYSFARLLQPKQVEEKVTENEISHEEGSLTGMNDLLDLMGSEGCHDKEEECLNRRMIAEAHLDYIYTQHHKP
ncbi:putative phytosulfokines 6 [Ziziphus jujuba]|uniref:Phytosulfokine n=2 Tax=Ziziphus jujuba TaxID=326968 RepID=A0A6P4BHX4_ZIZJJ|nr:putative phytosulfokines 6 [Ziziphus jujuba]KAH7512109.1 hypothetical protein FEM48_Zijuj12G0055700 [Ziziphus jujuba var. spinosa]